VEGARLIYFDQDRVTGLLEHIASGAAGRAILDNLSEDGSIDFTLQRNQRAILSRLIAQADDLRVEGIIDLHQPEGSSRRVSWADVHPDQAIAVRGTAVSARDVQPASIRLKVDAACVRVFVNRDHYLHLNQSYLTSWTMTAVGKVRSTPHVEILAVAIGVVPP
jgi:hypothetical protein